MSTTDDRIALHGSLKPHRYIKTAEGVEVSVSAGYASACSPQPGHDGVPRDYAGPFDAVWVWFPTDGFEPPASWEPYRHTETNKAGTFSDFRCVPVALVRELIEQLGGEVALVGESYGADA